MSDTKLTLVIGASEKPERFSNKAIRRLRMYGHPVEAIALRTGEVDGVVFKTGFPELKGIDTVTLYIGPARQPQYYEYLLRLKPNRIIFNPGTENPEFIQKVKEHGIDPVEACTLVMLDTDRF